MKITFRPELPLALQPVPAINKLPDWYKKLSPFTDGSNRQKTFADNTKNITIKRCNPFGDALGAGYFILLEQELQVTKIDSGHEFIWLVGGSEVVSLHSKNQIMPEMISNDFDSQPYKFKNRWGIETPKGWSVLITHPLNRLDLPFYTLTGIVDTDKYKSVIELPFFIKKDFDGYLPAGTPIAQVIPIKRESWQKKIMSFDASFFPNLQYDFLRHIDRPYKSRFWQRKSYK